FRRLLTDPATGTLTDLAEKRYRPSTALDRAVRARDVTYRFPGCRRSANSAGTDLDQTTRWPEGPTTAANLAVLCRHHHRLKHTTRWNVTLHPSGVMTWTTPTGRTHQTAPWHYTDPNPPRDG
ncbi:MAG: HNH endonuclease, partial [Actinomycetia bacterium]|nr:HNH endonuclease [Actinomycetes bacterium]